MGSWQHAGRMLRGLRENRGWEVPKLAADAGSWYGQVGVGRLRGSTLTPGRAGWSR